MMFVLCIYIYIYVYGQICFFGDWRKIIINIYIEQYFNGICMRHQEKALGYNLQLFTDKVLI